MLAIAEDRPPEGPNWAYEWKWDGFRAIVAVGSDQVRAYSRRGRDMTPTYPELRTLPEQVPGIGRELVLIRSLTWAGVSEDFFATSSAARPAMCGAAIDVPW